MRGLLDVTELPVFTAQSVPVVAGHVWIGPDRRSHGRERGAGSTQGAAPVSAPLEQTFTTWGPCSAFALEQQVFAPDSDPGSGRVATSFSRRASTSTTAAERTVTSS